MQDDDKKLWHWVLKGVKPLKNRSKSKPSAVDQKGAEGIKKQQKNTSSPSNQKTRRSFLHPKSEPLSSDKHRSTDMDKRTFDRFKKGKRPIDHTVDLHGLTQAEAHQMLIKTIQNCYAKKKRNILIITGKGRRSGQGGGVLKRMLPQWLGDRVVFGDKILSVPPARDKDGGGGAFYVLLRRQR